MLILLTANLLTCPTDQFDFANCDLYVRCNHSPAIRRLFGMNNNQKVIQSFFSPPLY